MNVSKVRIWGLKNRIRSGIMTTYQLTKYTTFLYFFLRILINLCVSLYPLWLKNLLNPCDPCLKLVPIRGNSWLTQNIKTKPFQTHSNPFFQRAIFVFGPKTGILEDFRQTFLCKTKPFYKNFRLSMRHYLIGKMQNKAILTRLFVSEGVNYVFKTYK